MDILKISDPGQFLNEIERINSPSIHDRSFHLALARKCEEWDQLERAVLEYNLAIRDGCDDPVVLEKLSEYYYDLGKLNNASKLLENILKKNLNNIPVVIKLGSLYEEMNELEKTKKLYTAVAKRSGDQKIRSLLKNIETAYFAGNKPAEPQKEVVSDEAALKFIDLFSGREDCYARQWVNEKGESGYAPVKEHFSVSAAKNHFLGNHTVGVYQLRMNSTVRWAAFDIDIVKNLWIKILNGEVDRSQMMKYAFITAREIHDRLTAIGIDSYIEFSGFKGFHVWFFLDSPVPAGHVRNFLAAFLKSVPENYPQIHVEIFPKQPRLSSKQLGNLIKLPLGLHKKSSQYSYFVGRNGHKFEEQYRFLLEMKKTNKDRFLNEFSKIRFQTAAKQSVIENSDTEQDDSGSSGGYVEELIEFDPYSVPEFNYLIMKCEPIAYLIKKIEKARSLNMDEKVVLKFSLGHLNCGTQIVNFFFSQLPDIKDNELMTTKFSGNPISCAKIRKRLGDKAKELNCKCKFTDMSVYPNPVIHVKELENKKNTTQMDNFEKYIRFQHLIKEYIRIKEDIAFKFEKVQEIEKFFHDYFAEQKVEEIKTPLGLVRRSKESDDQYRFMIKI